VAVSADGRAWFLINASPDLRAQIEAFPGLQPSPDSPRNSPLAAVLLTNADLDHVLGLFLLRERPRLRVYAPEPVFQVLTDELRMAEILRPFCRLEGREPSAASPVPLLREDDAPSGLLFRALPLASKPPPFARETAGPGKTQSVAYEIVDERTAGRLVVAPDVTAITPELFLAMKEADAVLFDGTFWSPHELRDATGRDRTAEEMGHLPIRDGSLEALRPLKARHRIYLHINNTNPILGAGTPERAEVEKAGLVVGHDGMEFEL
jgi:pyrroloquinoline quinone biosynthesis protein B